MDYRRFSKSQTVGTKKKYMSIVRYVYNEWSHITLWAPGVVTARKMLSWWDGGTCDPGPYCLFYSCQQKLLPTLLPSRFIARATQ